MAHVVCYTIKSQLCAQTKIHPYELRQVSKVQRMRHFDKHNKQTGLTRGLISLRYKAKMFKTVNFLKNSTIKDKN